MSTVSYYYRLKGLVSPSTGPAVAMYLRGLKRCHLEDGPGTRRAKPLTKANLKLLNKFLRSGSRSLRYWRTIWRINLCFYCLLRWDDVCRLKVWPNLHFYVLLSIWVCSLRFLILHSRRTMVYLVLISNLLVAKLSSMTRIKTGTFFVIIFFKKTLSWFLSSQMFSGGSMPCPIHHIVLLKWRSSILLFLAKNMMGLLYPNVKPAIGWNPMPPVWSITPALWRTSIWYCNKLGSTPKAIRIIPCVEEEPPRQPGKVPLPAKYKLLGIGHVLEWRKSMSRPIIAT